MKLLTGFIAFCMERFDYDADSKLLLPLLNTIGLHEIGHALGWSSGQFLYFNAPENLPKSPLGGVSGDFPCANSESSADRKPKVLQGKEYGYPYDHLYYELQSSKMAQISRNIFNCPSMTGARLENQPTSSSCFGSHLDEVGTTGYCLTFMALVINTFPSSLSCSTHSAFTGTRLWVHLAFVTKAVLHSQP